MKKIRDNLKQAINDAFIVGDATSTLTYVNFITGLLYWLVK